MTSRPIVTVSAACLLAGLFLLPQAAQAQQWIVRPVIEIGVQYVENPRLDEGDGETDDITGGLLDVAAEFRRNTEISSVLFRPSAEMYRYSGDSDEDSESFFLDFNADRQGQRSAWRFAANFRQQQVFRGETTSSEFDDVGVDDDVQTGTGRTQDRRERDLWRIRPGVTFDVTERTGIRFDLNYLAANYDSQAVGEAIDYRSIRADASIVRTLTPDSRFEFGIFGSRYEPDNNRDTDAAGLRVRYEKRVSDISTFFIDAGAQETNVPSATAPDTEVSETSFLWNLGYRRRLERTVWRFDVGQAVTPSGAGFLVERDLYRASMQHRLTPRWTLDLSAVAVFSDSVADEAVLTDNDRDYLQGRAGLAFAMTRKWSLVGDYRLSHQDFADSPGDAQGHDVRLSLVYSPPIPTR
jgi:hypothetical protein